jgi:hypothetical protein
MKLFSRNEFAGSLLNIILKSTLSLLLISAISLTQAAYAQSQGGGRVRTVNESPAAEATITLNEQFFNYFLEAMFTQLREPEFPLSLTRSAADLKPQEVSTAHSSSAKIGTCVSAIVLERERDGVRTAVKFEDGRIVAPLAFSGSYDAALGCLSFSGWASSIVTLEYNRERQALMARVRVEEVHLNGIPRLASGVLISLVQSTIDKRFNPYELFRAEQVSPIVQIKAAGGALRLRAREMRPEIVNGALRIQIIYEFVKAE